MLEEKLILARPFLKDPLAVQAKLCRRMERFIKELFVGPSDNNAAEQKGRAQIAIHATKPNLTGFHPGGSGGVANSRC